MNAFTSPVTIEYGIPAITRPIASIDIESATAGREPDPWWDRIISLAIVKIFPNAEVKELFWEFNPEIPITPQNAAIHGYTNETVAHFPHFSEHASDVLDAVTGCDFIGYNLNGYDIPLLHCEFRGQKIDWNPIDEKALTIDAGAIFKRMEQRSLSAAVRFYLQREHDGAHGALADAKATFEVLGAQVQRYALDSLNPDQAKETHCGLDTMSLASLAAFARMGNQKLDLAGTVELNDEGVAVFTHKKMRGIGVIEDMENNPPGRSYSDWILRNEFSENTKAVLRKIIKDHGDADCGEREERE